MADNLNYPLGVDLYEGNDISDWSKLAQWAKFVYLRAGIGVYQDKKFAEFAQRCGLAGIPFGPYYVLWLASLPKDRMLKTYLEARNKTEFEAQLPPALDFEPVTVIDNKGRKRIEWPAIGDLMWLYERIHDALIYTNLAGLDIIKANLKSLSGLRWWMARYPEPEVGEMDVETTLALLLKKYGIQREEVLFMQTSRVGAYPPGVAHDTNADINRAITFELEPMPQPPVPQPPVPPPLPSPVEAQSFIVQAEHGLNIHEQSDHEAKVVGGLHDQDTVFGIPRENGFTELRGFAASEYLVAGSNVPPLPAPAPQGGELYYLKTREQLDPNSPDWNGSFSAIGGRSISNWIKLTRREVELIWAVTPNRELWRWACGDLWPSGKIYGAFDEIQLSCIWSPILISSTPKDRQIVRVLGHRMERRVPYVLIDAIPKSEDYSAYTPDKHPEYWLNCWTSYKVGGYGPSHNGLTFRMPLFNPASGFGMSGMAEAFGGFWVTEECLAEKV